MAYIGNTRSLLIVGSNTRDDLVTTTPNQVTFELSQEVPGGYESNITVLRQKYIIDNLISNNTSISVDQVEVDRRTTPSSERLLQSSDAAVRAALSTIKVGDLVKLSIPSQPTNSLNDIVGFPVVEVVYTGDNIKIYLQTTATGTINTTGNTAQVSITLGSLDNWEVLEPERQYTIGTQNGKTNRYITLTEAPQVNDKVYVLHKGEATYNFVPTVKSVGPNQLTENLRNFRTDRYTATGDTSLSGRTFAITGTEDPEYNVIDARSLLVTVDGEIFDSDGKDSAGQNFEGKWKLNDERDVQNRQTITFHEAPSAGKQIRILNLGFSTVSRRASFALGQATTPGQGSVGEDELKNDAVSEGKIRDGAVTNPKIRNNAVNGTKILLENNELLRSKTNTGNEFGLLRLSTSNITQLFGSAEIEAHIAGNKKVAINNTEIYPEVTNDVSLGTLTKRFKDLALSGTATVQGNINVAGTVDGVDVSALKILVDNIRDYINSGALSPIGSIMAWSAGNPTIPSGWLRCNGADVNTFTYRALHAIISNTYGGAAYQAGVTDQPGAITTFKLPDLVTRFPAGANQNATNIGTTESPVAPQASRALTHTHTGAAHTHDLNNHTHSVPGHHHSVETASSGAGVPAALNITTSGNHTTRIDHTHQNTVPGLNTNNVRTDQAENPIRDNITWSSTAGRGTHPHNQFNTEWSGSLNHTHRSWPVNAFWYPYIGVADYIFTSSQSLNHTHKINAKGTNDDGGTNKVTATVLRSPSGTIDVLRSDTNLGDPHNHDVNDDGNGSRDVATGPDSGSLSGKLTRWTQGPWASGNASDLSHSHIVGAFTTDGSSSTLDHRHIVDVPDGSGGHDHAGGLTMFYANVDAHYLPNSTNANDLRGTHTHGASSIAGAIGLRSGNNGNANFNTSGPSNDSTGSANYGSNLSGPAVSPHLVVNFIIKVFNPTVS